MKRGKIIDLSIPIRKGMRVFPGIPEPNLVRVKSHDPDGLQVTKLEMVVHAGTHVDAPCHMLETGHTITETPLNRLMGEGVVLDLTHRFPDHVITRADLETYDEAIRQDDIVILNTGYEKSSRADQYCTLEPSAASWLVDRHIRCLAVDMLSLDPISQKKTKASRDTHPSHHIILGAGIPLVECLVHLDALKKKRVYFCCLPLKLVGSDGAPARAIAWELDDEDVSG